MEIIEKIETNMQTDTTQPIRYMLNKRNREDLIEEAQKKRCSIKVMKEAQ